MISHNYLPYTYLRVVSSFVEDGNLPIEDLRRLLDEVEQSHKHRIEKLTHKA